MNMRRKWMAVMVVLAAVAAAHAETAEGSFARTLNVSGPVDLTVQTGSGKITVAAGGGGSVQVRATIRARDNWNSGLSAQEKVKRLEANPPIQQNGNTIVIGKIEDEQLRNNVSISYDLIVPAETRLNSQTGSGEQEISGINLPVRVSSGSGGVRVRDARGEVTAQTGSGDVELSRVGAATARAGSGSIRAIGISGEFSGSTGSGDIQLDQAAAGNVRLNTGSGNVRATGVKGALRAETGSGEIEVGGEMAGEWRLQAGSGSVRVSVPKQAGFNVDVRTSSGTIQMDHPVTMTGTTSRRAIRGTVRNGGPLLAVSTGSGDVTVR